MNLSALPHDVDTFDVTHALAPARRTLGLGCTAHWALLGLGPGALVGALLLVVAHLARLPLPPLTGPALAALGLLLGVAYGLTHWPAPLEAARRVDRHFDLKDRLTTALELRSSHSPLALLQRRDTALSTRELKLAQGASAWPDPREGATATLALALLAATLVWGAPRASTGTHGSPSVVLQHRRAAAAIRVKQIAAALRVSAPPTTTQTPQMQQLQKALARLHTQLLHATSPSAALQAISSTQQQLHTLERGLHPVNTRAVAQLNSALGQYLQHQTSGKAAPPTAAQMARELDSLARAMHRMTPAQRAALARSLMQAANQTSDSALRSDLRQAASALANGDPTSASQSTQQASRALSRSASQQSTMAELQEAQGDLSSAKDQINGTVGPTAHSPAASGAGRPGGGKGTGQARGAGAGKGQTQGHGLGNGKGSQAGKGQGSGRGQGHSSGAGQNPASGRGSANARGSGRGQTGANTRSGQSGRGAAGAHGTGGTGRNNPTRPGSNVQVYVPGRSGQGKTVVQSGPTGAPETGGQIPYRQVVARYAASAHQALDRSALPPALQAYVRAYFTTITH